MTKARVDSELAFRIREAEMDEADLLTDLAMRSKAVHGYSDAFMERCRPELTITAEYIANRTTYVAESLDGVVGFCSLRRGRTLELDFLYVDPRFLGRGHGGRLLEHALSVARRMGDRILRVESDPGAESFYIAHGGQRTGDVESPVEKGRYLPLLEFDLHAGEAGDGS
jgi:GNAT superfamily N-acetyltransferase